MRSASARATISSNVRRANGNSCAAPPRRRGRGAGGGGAPQAFLVVGRRHLLTRPVRRFVSSLELVPKPAQAAGDATCDRPRRDVEPAGDRPVALVLCKEAIEDLLACLREARERLPNCKRVFDVVEIELSSSVMGSSVSSSRPLPARKSRHRRRQLCDPRPEGRVVAKCLEAHEGA